MRVGGLLVVGCLLACGGRSTLDSQGAAEPRDAGGEATVAPLGGVEYPTCAPTDGPAFGLRITSDASAGCAPAQAPSGDYDEIDAWLPLPAAASDLVITEANGHGATCTNGATGTACTIAASTRLHVEPASGGVVRGQYTMTFADGTARTRAFVVQACAWTATCG